MLELAELGIPISLESSGLTLEIINGIDPEWIKKFKNLINNKNIELIGSGYSQLIGPLVPSKVNDWNQKLGIEAYKKINRSSARNSFGQRNGIFRRYY